MNNSFTKSPFIKTAFVAIALVTSSISSASYAGDLLETISTQGLAGLSPEADHEFNRAIELINQGILVDNIDEIIKRLEADITKKQKEIADQEKAVKTAQEEFNKADKALRDLERTIGEAAGFDHPAYKEPRAKRLKAEAALKAANEKLANLKAELAQMQTSLENAKKLRDAAK